MLIVLQIGFIVPHMILKHPSNPSAMNLFTGFFCLGYDLIIVIKKSNHHSLERVIHYIWRRSILQAEQHHIVDWVNFNSVRGCIDSCKGGGRFSDGSQ